MVVLVIVSIGVVVDFGQGDLVGLLVVVDVVFYQVKVEGCDWVVGVWVDGEVCFVVVVVGVVFV